MTISSRGAIGIVWWGSWFNGATIGDLLVVKEVVELLEKEDVNFTLFASSQYDNLNAVPMAKMQISEFTAVIFVCGPVVLDFRPLQDLATVLKSRNIPFIGVNVSILSPLANPFNRVIAREGLSKSFFDLSPLQHANGIIEFHFKRKLQVRKIKVGITLRGHQSEYGAENCRCKEARDLIDLTLSKLEQNSVGVEICEIDHAMDKGLLSVCAYDQIYQSCDFVITTRFHGALMAVRNLIPFVAVDQIEGGAKVTSLLQELCPEKVIGVDYCAKDLADEIQSRLSDSLFSKVFLLLKARRLASATRREITSILGDLAKGY